LRIGWLSIYTEKKGYCNAAVEQLEELEREVVKEPTSFQYSL
jgi:hypothetical protein